MEGIEEKVIELPAVLDSDLRRYKTETNELLNLFVAQMFKEAVKQEGKARLDEAKEADKKERIEFALQNVSLVSNYFTCRKAKQGDGV